MKTMVAALRARISSEDMSPEEVASESQKLGMEIYARAKQILQSEEWAAWSAIHGIDSVTCDVGPGPHTPVMEAFSALQRNTRLLVAVMPWIDHAMVLFTSGRTWEERDHAASTEIERKIQASRDMMDAANAGKGS